MSYSSFMEAASWWRSLQPYRADGSPNPTADRGALARLRRADVLEATEDPAVFDLFRRLGGRGPAQLVNVALCAGVLATVRQDDQSASAARQLGVQPGSDKPQLSTLRFRSLLAADTPQDRLTALRRAVSLNNQTINVEDIAAACLDWSDERRRRWAFEYYDGGSVASAHETTTEGTI